MKYSPIESTKYPSGFIEAQITTDDKQTFLTVRSVFKRKDFSTSKSYIEEIITVPFQWVQDYSSYIYVEEKYLTSKHKALITLAVRFPPTEKSFLEEDPYRKVEDNIKFIVDFGTLMSMFLDTPYSYLRPTKKLNNLPLQKFEEGGYVNINNNYKC